MKNITTYYKRNYPHYQPLGCTYFVTTRLAGTIPKKVYEKFKKRYNQQMLMISKCKNVTKRRRLLNELYKNSFLNYDSILDKSTQGRNWLSNKLVANLVQNSIHRRDNKDYELYAYTIMPNHIHIIFKPIIEQNPELLNNNDENYFIVTKIMKSLKMYTGKEANNILNRSGPFWKHESYDRVIRNNLELHILTEYILKNPVKAKLCNKIDDWPWSYYNPEYYQL
jgi:REP element-mobilizing transposase RayT